MPSEVCLPVPSLLFLGAWIQRAFFTQRWTWEPISLASQSSGSVTRAFLPGPAGNALDSDSVGGQLNHYGQEASCVYLDSLSFTFLNCKMGIMLIATPNCGKEYNN